MTVEVCLRWERRIFFARLRYLNLPFGWKMEKVIDIDLACNKCKKEGKEKECKHKYGLLPPWHQTNRMDDLEMMMQDRKEDFLREMKGIQSNSNETPAFNTQKLQLLLDPKRLYKDNNDKTFKHLFVSVDPSAGGKRSDFAIVSCIYDNREVVVRIWCCQNKFECQLIFVYLAVQIILCLAR